MAHSEGAPRCESWGGGPSFKSPEIRKGNPDPPWRYTTFKQRPAAATQLVIALDHWPCQWDGITIRSHPWADSCCSGRFLAAPPLGPIDLVQSLAAASHHQRVFLRQVAWSVFIDLPPAVLGVPGAHATLPCPRRCCQAGMLDPAVGCPALHPLAAAGTAGERKAIAGIWL